jgi:hypothetical protein
MLRVYVMATGLSPSRQFTANGLTTAKICPSLHNLSSSIEAVRPSIGSLDRSPDLMAQRFLKQIAGKPRILSPRPECGSQSVWRDWAAALGISPTRLARLVAVHVLQEAQHGHVAQRFARLEAREHKLS